MTLGVSGGGGEGNFNGGGNFNISKSESRWVNEQTSFSAGGSVDIYVENRTTLTGAVIASDTGDLTFDTGSFEYSHIKDRDYSYNVGGGVNLGSKEVQEKNKETGKTEKKDKTTYSVTGDYGFSDKRQINYATVGEGEIIVRDGTVIGSADTYEGLKREVALAQYGTIDTGFEGGFIVDDTLVDTLTSPVETYEKTKDQVLQGVEDYKETAITIYNEAGELIEKTVNYLDDKGFKTDEEVKAEEAEKARQEEIERAAKAFEELLSKVSEETRKILEQTGWGGEPLNISKNLDVLDQSTTTLKGNGLPGNTGACIFLSTIYGAADVLGITLTPKQIATIYNAAKNNGSVNSGDSAYYVNDYTNLAKTVAAVVNGLPADKKNLQASAEKAGAGNLTVPNTGKGVNPGNAQSRNDATIEIVDTLSKGGSVDIQYRPLPGRDSNHTMSVTGSHIDDNGTAILHIRDTNPPKRETYVNTGTMEIYYIEEETKKRKPINRTILNYRTITNSEGAK